jgi:hypothetical protein
MPASSTVLPDGARITTSIEIEVWTARSGRPSMSRSTHSSASRARLTISIEFEGHGIGRALVPLIVEREARKEMRQNLATLEQRLEAVA